MSFFCISENLAAEGTGCDDNVVVLAVSGEIDYAASPRLKGCILGHIKDGGRRLVLDLSAATFIDSTAIGVLVGAVSTLRVVGGSLAVVCAEENERVRKIFEIAGVDSLIALHSSRDEGLSALVGAG
jgi:anti-sigma B factor antagonist